MVHVIRLTDGTNTIDLTESWTITPWRYGLLRGGTDWGRPSDDPRLLKLRLKVTGTTVTAMWQNVQAVSRLLQRAGAIRTMSGRRSIYLEIQLDTMTTAVRHYIRRASITGIPDAFAFEAWSRRMLMGLELTLEVEPYGLGSEVTVANSVFVRGVQNPGVTHMYVHYTGATVFSVNVASLIDASMWQRTKLATTQIIATPQNGDVLYFGNNLSSTTEFDRLILGLQTAMVSSLTAVWEYWNGSAWTAFTPTSDFQSPSGASNEWKVARSLGQIVFGTLAGWASTTVNGVSALWVRWRITAFTSMTTIPVRENGPVRSLYGYAPVPSGVVGGDAPAKGRVELQANPGGADLSGVRAAIHVGLNASVPPPFNIPAHSANRWVPPGPEVTATAVSDGTASNGERVDIGVNQSLTDRAFNLAQDAEQGTSSGGTDIRTATLSGSDKLSSLAGGNFIVEALVTIMASTNNAFPIVCQWDDAGGSKIFWMGVDNMQARALIYRSGAAWGIASGTTLQVGSTYLICQEFDRSGNTHRLYVNASNHASFTLGGTYPATGVTTQVRIGKSVSFNANDARNGQAEVFAPIKVHEVRIKNQNISGCYPGGYSFPTVAWQSDGNTRWLLACNDNAANNTVTDSSGTPINGAMMNGGSAWSTNNTGFSVAGYFNAGTGGSVRALGWYLPVCLGNEFGGPYHVYLLARPNTSLNQLSDVKFQLQFNIGDSSLVLFTTPVAQTFNVMDVSSNGWQLIDMGVVTLPPVTLPQGVGNSSIKPVMEAYLYITHAFTGSATISINSLVLLPTYWFEAGYDTFRDVYDSNFAIVNGDTLVYDDEGDQLARYQSTSVPTTPKRNPYARAVDDRPRLFPNTPLWGMALCARGVDSNVDWLEWRPEDGVRMSIKAVPLYEMVGS